MSKDDDALLEAFHVMEPDEADLFLETALVQTAERRQKKNRQQEKAIVIELIPGISLTSFA